MEAAAAEGAEMIAQAAARGGTTLLRGVGNTALAATYLFSPGTGNETGGPNPELLAEKRMNQQFQQQQQSKEENAEPEKQASTDGAKKGGGRNGLPPDVVKLKGNQGYRDSKGNIWKKDQLHKDHWDVTDKKGRKIREVTFEGKQIWPSGRKNKNKKPNQN